jgi:hypothetical protein
MKKTTMLFIALAAMILISAISTKAEALPKGSCTWTRPALYTGWDKETITRPTRDFQGVWQRYHGEIVCGPSGSKHKKAQEAPVIIPATPIVIPPVAPPEAPIEHCFIKNELSCDLECRPHWGHGNKCKFVNCTFVPVQVCNTE